MKNPKIYFVTEVILFVLLTILTIRGVGPNDPWQYNWVFQLILLGFLNLISLILVRLVLKEDKKHQKIISGLALLFFVYGFISFKIIIG